MTEQTEEEYLAAYDPSGFPPVAVTADFVLFSQFNSNLFVLLVQRANHPYKGFWALPGGFMDPNETLKRTAARELLEETSIDIFSLIEDGSADEVVEIGSYSEPNRDKRMRVVSVAFGTVVDPMPAAYAADDAVAAEWCLVNQPLFPTLAFDHESIIRDARELLL